MPDDRTRKAEIFATIHSLPADGYTRSLDIDYGIEPEYIDTWGRKHVPSDETRRLIRAALGATEAAGPLDPTIVVREDAEFIPLRTPAEDAGSSIKLEIRWENGDVEHHPFWLPELREDKPGERLIPLPKPLRLGYHELRIYSVRQPELTVIGEAHFIVCPRQARTFEGRAAGVALSLYGVRSARDWGCGDITDLRSAIDVFARTGAAFIALNPLHAIANRQPYNTSPYLPQSSLYRNFIYIDVEQAPGYLPEEAIAREATELRATEHVEYERVAHLKLRVLGEAFGRVLPSMDRYTLMSSLRTSKPKARRCMITPCIAHSMRRCTGAIPTYGCGRNGRSNIAIRARRLWRISRGRTGRECCSSSFCNGSFTCNWRKRRSTRSRGV